MVTAGAQLVGGRFCCFLSQQVQQMMGRHSIALEVSTSSFSFIMHVPFLVITFFGPMKSQQE